MQIAKTAPTSRIIEALSLFALNNTSMGLSDIRNKIAIFIIAILCTAGVGYAVVIGMHWVFVYIANFSLAGLTPVLSDWWRDIHWNCCGIAPLSTAPGQTCSRQARLMALV